MEKEKLTKDLVIMLQPSLHKKFKDACARNYETVSNVVRAFVREYVKQNETKQ
jgi:metal-responsive CopG/Arc/MetJ family transcriptional regulator